ncbi:hypothetical protein E4H04_07495 [Candidatus Bathyarchaeota archaeon]|nr:MAG: hypothetical protein E4H04_07495 [Candidatus Bathyarchaeota archaeon]
MSKTVTEKILSEHITGDYVKGKETELRVTHTLIHDGTSTMTDLQFEAMNIPRVKTERACYTVLPVPRIA